MILIGKIVLLSLLSAALNFVNVNEQAYSSKVEGISYCAQSGGNIFEEEYMLSVELNDGNDKIATVSVKNSSQEEVF